MEENWNNRGLFLLCECFLSFRGFSVLLSVSIYRGNLWIAVRKIGIVELCFFLNERMLLVISWFFTFSVCRSKFVDSCEKNWNIQILIF